MWTVIWSKVIQYWAENNRRNKTTMAILALSTYANKVLIEAPSRASGIKTFSATTTTIFPGYVVTATAETDPDVVVVGTANDVTTGVALCKPNHDIDTAYAAGEFFPVALAGSGAVVWTYLKASAGAAVVGTPILTDAGTGVFSIIGEGALYEYVGKVWEYSADQANDRPVKVVLD